MRNEFFPYGTRGMQELTPGGLTMQATQAIGQQVMERKQRSDFLQQYGDVFWLPVELAIGTTPAAGTQFTRITNNVEFDLLVVGAICNLRLSDIQIVDSARNRALLNAPAPIWMVCQWVTTTASYTNSCWANWVAPYYLPPRSQFSVTITADGTESNGDLVFICKQPPTTQA